MGANGIHKLRGIGQLLLSSVDILETDKERL